MGHTTIKHELGSYQDFWPDDTEQVAYFSSMMTLSEILDACKILWPDATNEEITLSSEYIQTRCLYYDSYCPADYKNFLKIEYTKCK